MAEPTCDVIVFAGKANVTNPWKVPGVATAMDFSAAESYFMTIPHSRVHELRDLGFEVQVAKGDDPHELAVQAAKDAEKADKPAEKKPTAKGGAAAKETT
jgi:hypothetical protein